MEDLGILESARHLGPNNTSILKTFPLRLLGKRVILVSLAALVLSEVDGAESDTDTQAEGLVRGQALLFPHQSALPQGQDAGRGHGHARDVTGRLR